MLEVAIGVIKNNTNQFLMTTRTSGPFAGFWEFPGGKVEHHETAKVACIRELKEELGVHVLACHFIGKISHSYPNQTIILNVFLVDSFKGVPHGREAQAINWVDHSMIYEDIDQYLPSTHQVLALL